MKLPNLLFVGACLCGIVLSSCTSNPSVESTTTAVGSEENALEEKNKALINKWIEARNTNDLEAALTLWPDEWQERITMGFNGTTEAFPDVQIISNDMLVDGNKIALHWTLTGTHQGTYQGIEATGKEITWVGIDIYTLADGKIIGIERATDPAAIPNQLNAE